MSAEVTAVRYWPHDATYPLDIEVIDAAELRARVASRPERGYERVDFQCFLFVRSGTYNHTVDFETYDCAMGSCLQIGPGQAHRFGPSSEWDGWILLVGPHHIPNGVLELPTHVRTNPELASAVIELFERMAMDTIITADHAEMHDLLALQAQVLVRRLALGEVGENARRELDPIVLRRFREYRHAVDQNFMRWHLVEPYIGHLGYSAKSLNRACRAASDATAKRVIIDRIILEAKRRLAHGDKTAARIGTELGFDEPTNFAKFFRREVGTTPAMFRAEVRRH